MAARFMNSVLRNTRRGVAAALFLALACAHALADGPKGDAIAPGALAALDGHFQTFSTRFYAKLVRFDSPAKADSFAALARAVDRQRHADRPVDAVAAVVANLTLVEKNVDNTPVIGICGLLFEANEWNTAARLYEKIKAQGDKSLVANLSLALAKHHFDRQRWKETIGVVEGLRSDLPPEDLHHALLMHGIALQQLKKHRVALVPYGRIPPSSRYYTAARLNMAVANIRQDWWTDAHVIINDLLADDKRRRAAEMTDRLYTVLGYSLLQQHYHRNSREAFRNVALDGKYADPALLGIALTAAYQEDYVGALNAINILKDRKTRDLPVDEAHLLLPHVYEKLGQLTTASTGYAEAIAYYEGRVRDATAAVPTDAGAIVEQLVAGASGTVTLSGETVDLGDKLPKFVFDNVRMLARFQPHVQRIGDAALAREYAALAAEQGAVLQTAARRLLEERAEHLTHYLSQSRYGLARMQDHDATAPK
jgi:tetratricopeptide (TPR) repeat protein